MLAKNRVIFSIAPPIIIFLLAAAAIFWTRGFKPDFKSGQIKRTGIIVASSIPTGAQVYLDDRLTSATNTNIGFLEPKIYKVKIEKDGYTIWQKEVEVKADLATEIKVLLFPLAPQIKPLTSTGAVNPSLSPDSAKIVYGVSGERGGVYLLLMGQTPLPFRQDTRLLAKNQPNFDFSKATFLFGPDSKQVIAQFTNEKNEIVANLLIDTDKSEQEPRDITGSLTATLTSWQDQINARAQTQALTLPQNIKDATAEASVNQKLETTQLPTTNYQLNYFPTGLIFSPDEEKILFKNKEGKYKIYDSKNKKEYTLPDFSDLVNVSWYPDSNHLVIIRKDLVTIIETDGTNNMTVFSGKFEDGFVFAGPTGDRLIILTTLTQTESTPANLYSINLR